MRNSFFYAELTSRTFPCDDAIQAPIVYTDFQLETSVVLRGPPIPGMSLLAGVFYALVVPRSHETLGNGSFPPISVAFGAVIETTAHYANHNV